MAIDTLETPAPNGRADYPWLRGYPEAVDWHAEIPAMPLFSLLDHGVATYPDNVALDFLGKHYSYRELGDLVRRATKGLQEIDALPTREGLPAGSGLPPMQRPRRRGRLRPSTGARWALRGTTSRPRRSR